MTPKTFEEFWQRVQTANPALANSEVRMTTANFRKALRLAWDEGVAAGLMARHELLGLFNTLCNGGHDK